MKVIKDIEQGTLEWLQLRQGKVTGTRLGDVMGSANDRLKLIAELIAEEGTEQSKVFRPTPEMERGSAEEIFTVKRYEEKFGIKGEKVCICISDEFPWLAYSPDLLIPEGTGKNKKYTKGVEIKNPDSKTMIFYKMSNMIQGIKLPQAKAPFMGVPADYKWQVVDSFLVNEDQQVLDFVISDARFIDDDAKMYVIEVRRDNPLMQQALQEAREELIRFREDWLSYKETILPLNF